MPEMNELFRLTCHFLQQKPKGKIF